MFLVGVYLWGIQNMTHFYNTEMLIFMPIFIILAKLSTQIHILSLKITILRSNLSFLLKYHIHIYNMSRKAYPIFPHIPKYNYIGSYPHPGMLLHM